MLCSLLGTAAAAAVNSFSICLSSFELEKHAARLCRLTGSALRSALPAEPPENQFAFAHHPLTEGARGRPGHVVPLNVFNISAAIADEVVMPRALRIESR